MSKLSRFLYSFIIFLLIMSGTLFVSTGKGNAQGPGCSIGIQKLAEPDDGTTFNFTAVTNGAKGKFSLKAGEIFDLFADETSTVIVKERVLSGWRLEDTDCMTTKDVTFTQIEDGIEIVCNSPSGNAFCAFRNVQSDTISQIPTLSEWGLIAAAAGLGLIGVFFAVRKRLQTRA